MKGFFNLKLQSVLIFSRCKVTMMLNSSLSNKLFSYHLYLEEQAASATVQEAKAAAATTAGLHGGAHLAPRALRRLAAILYPQRLRLSSEEDRSSWSSFLADIAFSLISWLNAPAAVVATLEAEASHDPILYWLLPHWLPGCLAAWLPPPRRRLKTPPPY